MLRILEIIQKNSNEVWQDAASPLVEEALPYSKEAATSSQLWDENQLLTITPQETVLLTRLSLADQGWCLWKCSVLNDDVIVLVRSEKITGFPQGYPVYTLDEIEKLFDHDIKISTLRLIHQAKKLTNAVLKGVAEAGGI